LIRQGIGSVGQVAGRLDLEADRTAGAGLIGPAARLTKPASPVRPWGPCLPLADFLRFSPYLREGDERVVWVTGHGRLVGR
jgi:hypothetical protein